jgi:branched-chain amino acid transport system substrate-binding protein
VFFAGGGAVKLVKDYDAAGLKKSIPLYGPGFLTDGTLEAQGASAEGLLTTLHYADQLDNPKNNAFRAAYRKAYNVEPDVYAMQGYDSGQLLAAGTKAVGGDMAKRDALIKAMQTAKIDSPRGPFSLSRANNPVQDYYLRRVEGKENKAIGIAIKGYEDPAIGCKM